MENVLYQAILLLCVAEVTITRRRLVEEACGYPESYGGDAELLFKIKEFLHAEECAEHIDAALAALKEKRNGDPTSRSTETSPGDC
jgi:hypothetical protein